MHQAHESDAAFMVCRGASKAKPMAQPESVAVAGEEVMKVLRDGLARLQVANSNALLCLSSPASLI